MEKFILNNKVDKKTIKTAFGVITISNITFDSSQIQNILPDLIFEDENLKFMFQKEKINGRERQLILKRFLPSTNVDNITQFIIESIRHNKTFYSFLAEGMLSLVFRDIYGYDLSVGIIDITETLNDTHSGADVCMFDKDKNILILGEAKFYENFKNGLNKIIEDFTKKRIFNKLDSFKRKIESNDDAWEIVLKNLKKDTYNRMSLIDFMQQEMVFAGFVLHNNVIDMNEYLDSKIYDDFDISVEALKANIINSIESELINSKYNIVLFHLPINDKKTLIRKIIERANTELCQRDVVSDD